MIKSKKCSIEICNLPAFSKGFCKKHCNFKDLKSSKKEIKSKVKSIKSSRESTNIENKETSLKRDVYFEYHISKCTNSDESGNPINNPNRSNCCHIIDKGRHPSLEDNLENCLYLTFSEHERFDKLLFSLEFAKLDKEFPNSMKIIRKIGNKLLDLCEENTVLTRALNNYLNGGEFKS